MSGFAEIMHQSEERWRADMLEQVCAIRELLEAIAQRRSTEDIDIQTDPSVCDATGTFIVNKLQES